MIYREIITVNTPTYEIAIPEELRGKEIEILAFEIEKPQNQPAGEGIKQSFADRIKEFTFNSGGYKFNREEANDYP